MQLACQPHLDARPFAQSILHQPPLRRRIRLLAALLRVADGLDRTCRQLVRGVRCRIDENGEQEDGSDDLTQREGLPAGVEVFRIEGRVLKLLVVDGDDTHTLQFDSALERTEWRDAMLAALKPKK